ncbi:MAG: hypothetical protein ABI674_04790 [Spartobacteria bacterium]
MDYQTLLKRDGENRFLTTIGAGECILVLAGARLEAGSTLAGESAPIGTGVERAIIRLTTTYEKLI